MPANPPSAAPLDLDALERLASTLRDAMDACDPFKFTITPLVGGSPYLSDAQNEVWQAYGALTAACTPVVILALVAAARRGVEDTEKRAQIIENLPRFSCSTIGMLDAPTCGEWINRTAALLAARAHPEDATDAR